MRVDVITDAAAAGAAADVINRAYAAGERGLWRDGVRRITPEAVTAAIRAGELLGASADGRLAGCARVWPVDAGRAHPEKERLRAWYLRLGYAVVRTAPFEEVASHGADDLAMPCAFLVFRKPLA